jgi:nucleoporin NDC1
LTDRSHEEDRFGVAQLTGSNATVLSTLISSLLAIGIFMGKKTSLQPQHLMGPVTIYIKWNTPSTGRRDVAMAKKRGGPLHAKTCAMAAVLRNSIFGIVSAFHDEMRTSTKAGLLEKDWVTKRKPLFGT